MRRAVLNLPPLFEASPALGIFGEGLARTNVPRRVAAGSWRWVLGIAVASVLVAVAGCGRRGLDGTVPVSGRVTFAGGDCPQPGYVFFVPTADQPSGVTGPRAGSGRFEQDGRFEVTTLTPGDGLVPGSYTTRIVCEQPSEDDDRPGPSFVPSGFAAPGLTVAAGAAPLTYDVDVPKVAPQSAARTKK